MDSDSPFPRLGSYRTGAYSDRPQYFWRPGKNEARCTRDSHSAPSESCTCGFYALRDPFDVSYGALGGVVGWGRVVDGVDGWRAQFAAVAAIYGGRNDAAELAAMYDVPLCATLEELAAQTAKLAEWMGGADLLEASVDQGGEST